jgi:peroxiredoxin
VAVSVDSPEDSREMAEDRKIGFPLLSDPDMRVISLYGVADADREIAVPAVFLVGQDGTVQWRQVGEFIGTRPLPSSLLEVIDTRYGPPPPG